MTPPSTSYELAVLPAFLPVTSASDPDTVVPSWRVVAAGLPRCQAPAFAVSVPSGFVFQPPNVSKSSYSGPQFACDVPASEYGQPAASMSVRIAFRLRSVWAGMTSSGG